MTPTAILLIVAAVVMGVSALAILFVLLRGTRNKRRQGKQRAPQPMTGVVMPRDSMRWRAEQEAMRETRRNGRL